LAWEPELDESLVWRDVQFMQDWKLAHFDRCWACHKPAAKAVYECLGGLHVHHMIFRSRARCDRSWNLSILCNECHESAHGGAWVTINGVRRPGLDLAHVLWLKQHEDPDDWQPELLVRLNRGRQGSRRLPNPAEPPDWYMEKRLQSIPWWKVQAMKESDGD